MSVRSSRDFGFKSLSNDVLVEVLLGQSPMEFDALDVGANEDVGEFGSLASCESMSSVVEAIAPPETRSRNSTFEDLVRFTPFPIKIVVFAFMPFHVALEAFITVAFRTSSCHVL